MENKPTLQDAISLYNFLETMKDKETKSSHDQDINRLGFNAAMAARQADIFLWITEYHEKHFSVDSGEWGNIVDQYNGML